jgi:DNA-binding LacI/PurR family transcriptional regulator
MSVTLQEVAELAGVSMGTASQALNQRPNVALATRQRVIDAARTLGYPLKPAGNDAEEAAITLIGMLVKHDVNLPVDVNAFYSHVQAGVERACRQNQINLMYAAIEVDKSNRPVAWPALVNERQLDGLLLLGTLIDDALALMQQRQNVPMVLIDSYEPTGALDAVLIDNAQGVELAINHLVHLGHRHIGLVGYNRHSPPSFQERYRAYCAALAQHGIEQRYVAESHHSISDAYRATQQLLHTSPAITAIFGCMDLAAFGAMNACLDAGLRVPEDISIMGFDNIDLAGEIRPGLTTVHVHKNWLGALGVRRLIERVRYPDQPATKTLVSTYLIERDSVCPPAR